MSLPRLSRPPLSSLGGLSTNPSGFGKSAFLETLSLRVLGSFPKYLTSKTCSECGKIKKNLGSNKVFECVLCNLKIDRDINASINIYKNENLRIK